MKPFALFAVLMGACVVSSLAYSKCDFKLIKKIKDDLKDSANAVKVKSLLENGEALAASTTSFYFDVGTKCAYTKLDIDDKFTVTLYDSFGKSSKDESQLKKDDKLDLYYRETKDGVKIYSVPFYDKADADVLGLYTCADKELEGKKDDSILDAIIRVRVKTSEKDAEDELKKAKPAVEAAKKYGKDKYDFTFSKDFPLEECLKKVK